MSHYLKSSLLNNDEQDGLTKDGRPDLTNFEMDLIDTRVHSYSSMRESDSEQCCEHSIIKPACVPITILSLVVLTIVFYPLLNEELLGNTVQRFERTGECFDMCRLQIVESIPTNVSFGNFTESPTIYNAWKTLLDEAKSSIDFAVFYWNLRDESNYSTSAQGRDIFNKILAAGKRGVKLRIAQNSPSYISQQDDAKEFAEKAGASVRSLNFDRLLGGGVLHTKFWIVDEKHIYIGSANMDWKSLTEVKELGYVISNCSCLASEFSKIFTVYWRLGMDSAKVPAKWPLNLRTYFNYSRPLTVSINSKPAKTFVSSSPQRFNTKDREHDLSAITKILKDARKFAHIAVMDYLPTTVYLKDRNRQDDLINIISDAYISISFFRLLISHWNHSRTEIVPFLKSLIAVNEAFSHKRNFSGRVEAKLFTIDSSGAQLNISYARVNHNKYMVTERVAYVGTSNWVGDYFINTAGVGLSFISSEVVQTLNSIFLRDWESEYAKEV
uniref:PLD phosphodiesterase domain-containing protein n=1 Tax=Syphacia muris TaxID=451379 RepID=A0A0N5AVJ0_9BILA